MRSPFGNCLNTSTLRGQGLSLLELVDVAAAAGYEGIEPWVREIDAYVDGGGTLADLARYVADKGLAIPNLIGFFEWAVDDPQRRAAGLAEARRNLEMAAVLGCPRVAAPPFGVTDVSVPLPALVERYRVLLGVGDEAGAAPMVEFWGASRTLSRLGEAVYVAMESGHRDACVLADIFHMYRGGSPHSALRLAGPATLGLLHINDYPAQPPREALTDADRVYPGDGVAPLVQALRDLVAVGYSGMLSLELFNQDYWAQDALAVARMGVAKVGALVSQAMGVGA